MGLLCDCCDTGTPTLNRQNFLENVSQANVEAFGAVFGVKNGIERAGSPVIPLNLMILHLQISELGEQFQTAGDTAA